MQTLNRDWHRAVKRVVVAHIALAKTVKPSDRKLAQQKCDLALAVYRITTGKKLDRESGTLATKCAQRPS
jgi:hypothetical protein